MADITITEGDTLEVDYSLENTGDGSGTFDPRLFVQGVQEDQDTGITLDPAQTATGTLQWPTESGDAVTDALAEAVTDDTSDSITVTVSAIPDSGVARWTLDDADTDSGTAIDSWGNNDGTINGATTGVSGANQTYSTNEAYRFDGTDDHVEVGQTGTTYDSFSISAWVNPNSTPDGAPILSGDGDTRHFQFRGEDLLVFNDSGEVQSVTQTLTNDTWTFVTAVVDNSSNVMRLYKDSTESSQTSITTTARDPALRMGADRSNSNVTAYLDGDIDDVRLYSKALSGIEVSDLYNTGSL